MAKKIAKIAPKPAAKPAPKPAPKPAAKPAPLDLVRNPNFNSAMAQKNYANLMAFEQARLAAQQGQQNAEDIYNRLNEYTGQTRPAPQQGRYTQGRLMGAPTNRPIPPGGGLGGPRPDQNAENIQREFGRYASGINKLMQEQPRQSRVPMGFSTYDEAGIPEDQRKILDDLMAEQQADIAANEAKRQDFLKTQEPIGGTMAGPIYGSLAGNVFADGTPANLSPDQLNAMRMKQYNQFLGQGMQNSNTLNQGGMANFAKMQAGMQAPQQTNTTTKPKMPLGGIGMQQPKQALAPRKFSTVKALPARFG